MVKGGSFESRIKIQNIIENQVPEFILDESPKTVDFLKQYYISQEYQGGAIDIVENLDEYLKVDNLTPEVIVGFATLSQDITSTSEIIPVNTTKGFPKKYGLLKINDEIITYTGITTNTFTGCIRGFSGITDYKGGLDNQELIFTKTSASPHIQSTSVKNLSALFLQEFFKKIKYSLTPGLENFEFTPNLNVGNFIKEARSLYESKGTPESFRILFNVLFGESPRIIDLEKFLIKPSSANYVRRNVVIAEAISGDPLKLVGQTIKKSTDEKTTAAVSEVEIISRRGKTYYKILLFVGYDDSFPTITGSFSITGSTRNIDYVSAGSSVITVDSTIGFPFSGKIYHDNDSITYTSKSINQFFGCSGIGTVGISTASIIRSEETYYGYEDGDISRKVDLRFTGALSDYKLTSRNSPASIGEKISIKSLGEIIDNPTIRNKTYKEIFANSWIYNTSSRYRIDRFGDGVISQFELRDDIDKSSLKVGDYIDILSRNSQLIIESGLRITEISGKQVSVNNSFELDDSFDYDVRRKLNMAASFSVPLEFAQITSDIQNVYDENDEFMYVASNSLPSYTINKSIFSYNAYRPAGKNEDTQSYSIIEFLTPVSFLTGSQVYYSYTDNPIPGLSNGFYYVEVVPGTGNTQIKLYSSKSAIENSNFLYFNNDEENIYVSKICDDNTVSPDVFPSGIHTFTLSSQKERVLSPQKILRKFPLDVNIGDGKSDLTKSGPVGMLINGVEILNYKSNNRIYYGPVESVNVLNGGTGYDVINPPTLSISPESALIQPIVRGSVEKVYVNPQEFDLDAIVSVAFTGGNGFGASFKPVVEKRRRELEFDARVLGESGGGVDAENETITFKNRHGLKDGEEIIYRPGNNPSIGISDFEGFNIDTNNTLKNGSTYYAKVISDKTIQIYNSSFEYKSGINTIGFNLVGTSGIQKFVTKPKFTLKEIKVIDGGSNYENRKLIVDYNNISASNDAIHFKNHGFNDGELIVYDSMSPIIGISTLNQYYVFKVDNDNFKLCDAGIGGTNKTNYERGKVVDIQNSGSGYHVFNYPPIKINVEYTTSGIGSTDFRGTIVATPIVRGEIIGTYVYDGGVGYGSTILNFHKKPIITVKNGKEAQLRPIIVNGKIEKVSVQYGGREYYSEPNIKVIGSGVGASFRAIISNNRVVDVIVINKGDGYLSTNTTLLVESAGKNAIFDCNVRSLEVNNNMLYANDISTLTDQIILSSYNNLQYTISSYSQLIQDQFDDSISKHSPIIGWAYDGNPIYGSYGYSNASSNTSPIKRLVSGYTFSLSNIDNRPNIGDLGFFVDDYGFTNSGDLDEYNGRFCITPEFPNGVYAYFATSIVDINNNIVGSFPYFIGNRFRSKFISENRFLNQNFDFNNSDLVRNTFPYKLNEKYADNDFIVESNEIINQLTSIESVFDDSINGFEIIEGGDGYKVGDTLIFDESDTKGGGLISQVSEVRSDRIEQIETSLIEYSDSLFIWDSEETLKIKIFPNHILNNSDYVNISGFFDNLKEINGSYPIGVSTYTSILLEKIESYWDTGEITDIYVSNIPSDISIGSSISIRNETFEVLNIFDNDIIRVNRYVPSYSNIDLISDIILPEIPQNVSIGSTVVIGNEVYLVLQIILEDNILKVGNLTAGTTHQTGSVINFIPDSFIIRKSTKYFDSKENNLVYFNPIQSIGIGTLEGVGVGVTYKIGKLESTISIPTQSIYLPNHPFKNNQKVILKRPENTESIFVSNNSSDVLFNGVFELLKNTTQETVYVINKTKDYIGIVTQIGLTTSTNGLFFHPNGNTDGSNSNNFRYSFESDFGQIKGNIQKVETIILTTNKHELNTNDQIDLKVFPNISVGIGTSSSVIVKYDSVREKLIINPINFSSSGINTITDQIRLPNHNLITGQKVVLTSSNYPVGFSSGFYYIYKVDDNNIQLCETLRDSLSNPPLILDFINSPSSTNQISPINPPLYSYKNNSLVFNVSDPSLFGYKFKVFYDSEFFDEFLSTGKSSVFSVIGFGTVGLTTNASITVKYDQNLNGFLYYSLENNGSILEPDKETKDYSKIIFIDSVYKGKYRTKFVSDTQFSISLPKIPERYSYSKSECDSLEYSTTSKTSKGSVSKIRIISPGFNFKSLPIFEKIESEEGDGAYIIPQSNNIGKINQIRILNEGFEYSSDKTLRPEASISKFLTIKDASAISSIKILDGGKNYISAPDLIVVNPTTGEKINSGLISCNLKLSSISSILIEDFPKGLPERTVNIIAVNNTNGVKIQRVDTSPSGNIVCTLVTPLSGFSQEPFSVGDRIYVEGIRKTDSSGDGFNSSDYGYSFFTVLEYLNGGTSTARKLEFSLSEFTQNPGIPITIQNGYASIVNYKNYPKFLVTQEFSNFIIGEFLEIDFGLGFNPEDLKITESNKNYIKVSGTFDLDVNYIVRGAESGSIATISKVKQSKGYFEVDYASFQKNGWSDNIGLLNEDIQVIPDNDYYQNLSYSIKSNQEWGTIISPVNNIVHPSGLKNFADTQILKNADVGDFIGTDRGFAIYDITDEHRVDTINNFDLTQDVDIDFIKNHSKFVKFKNKKLADYVECFTNRVLEIDDISEEFSTVFGDTSQFIFEEVDIIDPIKKYERYLIQTSNRKTLEVQLTEIVILSEDFSGDIFTFERGTVSTGFSTDVGYEANSLGNYYGYVDEVGNSYLRFDPADPYNKSYDIKFLNTSFVNSTPGIGTTTIGFVNVIGNTQTVNPGSSSTLIQDLKTKLDSAYLQVHIIDNVTGEMNYAEVFMDHDGTNTNISEFYSDTNEFFNSNSLGVFNSSIIGQNVNVTLTNTSSNQITVKTRNVGFGTTSSGIGTYIFEVSGQPSGSENTFRYDATYSNVSVASTIVSFNSSRIKSLKSTVKVSIGNTSALHQVMLVSDGSNTYTTQYPFLSIGSTSGIGTFGGEINGTNLSLKFYPDSSFSGTFKILNFSESFYSKPDYKNIPPPLTYNNIVEKFGVSRYLSVNDSDFNKLNFELNYKNTPIFMKSFDPSDSNILNLSNGVLTIPNHFFSTGERLIYRPNSSFDDFPSSPISIASTLNSSGIVTDILPTEVYAIKIDNNHLKIASRKEYATATPAIAVSFTSVGDGNSHELEMYEKNSKVVISIDNVIQSPISYKSLSYNLDNGGPIGTSTTIFALSGISSIFLGDILKIDDEYMKVTNVGLGTSFSGPIIHDGNIPLVRVRREFVGSSATSHSDLALVEVYRGSYNIEKNEIYFSDAPVGDLSDELLFDEDGLEEARSYFNGRVFLRSDYSTNVVFDDISPQFTGIAQTFALTVGGANTIGLGNSGENGIVLINGIFQSPKTEKTSYNNYEIIESSISPPESSIVFTGVRNNVDQLIIDDSDVNRNQIPRGGIIVSLGSTPGLGYAPLVGASVTAVSVGGTITSIGIGTSGSWGSGYRSPVFVEIYDPLHNGSPATITASVGAGGTLSFNVIFGGSGYTNPIINVSPPSYNNLSVTGVSRVSVGSTTETGRGLLLNLQVGASSTVGIGSTLFSVTDFEIVRNGYGFVPGDVFKPIGLVTGYGLSQPLEEFELTVLDTFTDSFSAWQLGQLDHIDSIKVYQNGLRKRFPLFYNSQLLSFHINPSNADSQLIDLDQLLLIFVNGILQEPGVSYEFNGGTSFTFSEAPKIDDDVDIYFYRGSTADSSLRDIYETIKDGDIVKIFSNNSNLGITTIQNSRVVTDISVSDRLETELYTLQGIDSENYKPLSWTKQKADRIINGQIVSKARDSLEVQIYPTAKIIRGFSSTDNAIFVDDAQFFNYEKPDAINFDGLIVSEKLNLEYENITNITSVQGFSGKIIGIQTSSGIGVPLALKFTLDPFLAPFPGLAVGNPIYIYNTFVGKGVTSIINSNSNVVGVGTTFLDNIYHISALSFSPEENTITCNIHSQSSIVGIATSGFHVGDFSWGRLGGFVRSSDPIAIGLSGYRVDVGLSTFPTIQRRGYGLRNIGPIKKEGISYERDVIYRFIDDNSGLLCDDDPPVITLSVSPESVAENGSTNLIFTFTRTGPTVSSLNVNYTVSGTATLGVDYAGISTIGTVKTVTFGVGSSITTVTVNPISDSDAEEDETVILTLSSGILSPFNYVIGTSDPVVGTIVNVESPTTTYWITLLGLDDLNFDYEYGYNVATDSENNIIAVGDAYDADGDGVFILIAKFDSAGNLLWQKVIGNTGEYYQPGGVTVDSVDNIYVCGYFGGDILTAKFNAYGALQWQKVLGGPTSEYTPGANSIAVDAANNVYVTGQTTAGAGIVDLLVAKYDTSGVLQWQKVLGSSLTDSGYSIAVSDSGSVYVTGVTALGNVNNTNSVLIAKYNSSGVLQWSRIYGDMGPSIPNSERGYGIAVDGSDNLYVTGNSNSEGAGLQDMLIVKFDSSGATQWSKLLGDNKNNIGWGIALDSSGGVYAVGEASGPGSGSPNDILLAKYASSDGTLIWQRRLGTVIDDAGFSIAIDGSDAICIVGYAAFGDTDDILVARLPSDGSGTGTYGDLQYVVSTLTQTTPSAEYVNESLALTDSASTLTDTVSSLNVGNGTLTPTLYAVI